MALSIKGDLPFGIDFVFYGESSFFDDRIYTCRCEKCGDSSSTGPDLLGKRALGTDLELQLTIEELPLKLIIFTNIRGDHPLDLPIPQEHSQSPISLTILIPNPAVIGSDGEVLNS